jgi:hypothetical protein
MNQRFSKKELVIYGKICYDSAGGIIDAPGIMLKTGVITCKQKKKLRFWRVPFLVP